ncbi:MAG: HlyD family type I secretion periplasmic adaptor subunit [Pseudomonadota bacterium]
MTGQPVGDHAFMSDVEDALRRGPSRLTHFFLVLVALMLTSGIVWAAWAHLDEITRGEGRVVPSSQLQIVQSLEGGIVEQISVTEGQIVEPGDILLRIDDTSFSSTVGEMRAQRRSLRAEIARLQAEAASAETVDWPEDLESDYPDLVAAEQALFDTRQQGLETQLSVLRQQAQQREQELQEVQLRARQVESSLDLARQELAINAPLANRGIVPKTEILTLRREINDLEGDLEGALLSIPRIEAAIREANERIQEYFLSARSERLTDLNNRRSALAVIDQSLRAATDKVVRADIRAPVRGIVNKINVATLGGVVRPGSDLVEIVPLDDTLLIEARIRPSDVAFLNPGQKAMVKFTAYDFSIYGGLPGKIERISADTSSDQQGETFYRVFVRTDANHLGTEAEPLPVIPGMITQVDILTGEKSVLDYLLKPILKARDEALRER